MRISSKNKYVNIVPKVNDFKKLQREEIFFGKNFVFCIKSENLTMFNLLSFFDVFYFRINLIFTDVRKNAYYVIHRLDKAYENFGLYL